MNSMVKNRFFMSAVQLITAGLTSLAFFACDDPVKEHTFSAPSEIMLTVINDHTLQISWQDNTDNEDGFKIARKDSAMSDYQVIATVGPNELSFSDTGLIYTNIYYYKVAAFRGSEVSKYSAGIVAPSEFPPPQIDIKAVHETKIELTWENQWGYLNAFELYRRETGEYDKIADLSGEETSYLDTGLVYGQNYVYSLVAVTDHNRSGTTTRSVNTTIQSATEVNSRYLDSKTIRISWTDNCIYETSQTLECDEGDGYIILAVLEPNVEEYTHLISSTDLIRKYRISTHTENFVSAYGTANSLEAWFDYNLIASGDYTFGQAGDTLTDLTFDYHMLNYEVTNDQFMDYLNFALEAGDISVSNDEIAGQFAGDGIWPADSYLFYELDNADTTRIFFENGTFSINSKHANFPVNYVSWFGAHAYAEYYGAQLPTEHEWEKAARGLSGLDFPWAEDTLSCEYANYSSCGGNLSFVGRKAENANYGKLYDMVANVAEWTTSSPSGNSNKVVKGGSYLTVAEALEVWQRDERDPTAAAADIGFRIVKY